MLVIKHGDILEARTDFIAHQCNCISTESAHLAKAVFTKFPSSNIYSYIHVNSAESIPNRRIPGNIIIRDNVINMLGQIYPGTPKYPSGKDSLDARTQYFYSCLQEIHSQVRGTISFPFRIGCGAAGGNWEVYLSMLVDFSFHYDYEIHILRIGDKKSISDEAQSSLW